MINVLAWVLIAIGIGLLTSGIVLVGLHLSGDLDKKP